MTNEEIAARAIADAETPVGGGYMHDGHLDGLTCEALAAAVVAALTEAGRIVPDGHVAIERGRWERVRKAAMLVPQYDRPVGEMGLADGHLHDDET